jgi:hypothetical protein
MVEQGLLSDWQAPLALRARFRCVYCGCDFLESVERYFDWTWDHRVPRKKGGGDGSDNREPCCTTCNGLKGAFDPSQGGVVTDRDKQISLVREYLGIGGPADRRAERDRHYIDKHIVPMREIRARLEGEQ